MKLFGRFHEMSLNQVCLYRTPEEKIKEIMEEHPEMQVTIKEYKPKKGSKEVTQKIYNSNGTITEEKQKIVFHPNFAKRHQVSLVEDLGFMKITLYSEPLSHKEVVYLGLKPIPAIKQKERLEESLMKLDPDTAHERQYHVEHVTLPQGIDLKQPKIILKKSKKK
jgi:hypothetical protein